MTKILYNDDIPADRIRDDKRPAEAVKSVYRLYIVNNTAKTYQGKGYWIDKGKLYRDRVIFKDYTSYSIAKAQAIKLLQETSEICIAIEDIKKNILYIIYRDKIDVLRVKRSYKTLNKRQAIIYIKRLTELQGGATVYKNKGYYIVISYK